MDASGCSMPEASTLHSAVFGYQELCRTLAMDAFWRSVAAASRSACMVSSRTGTRAARSDHATASFAPACHKEATSTSK
eukprot:scaffold179054_cov19-Tisochrysis_lutea.AAC.2